VLYLVVVVVVVVFKDGAVDSDEAEGNVVGEVLGIVALLEHGIELLPELLQAGVGVIFDVVPETGERKVGCEGFGGVECP
jgi:hypothetical protein